MNHVDLRVPGNFLMQFHWIRGVEFNSKTQHTRIDSWNRKTHATHSKTLKTHCHEKKNTHWYFNPAVFQNITFHWIFFSMRISMINSEKNEGNELCKTCMKPLFRKTQVAPAKAVWQTDGQTTESDPYVALDFAGSNLPPPHNMYFILCHSGIGLWNFIVTYIKMYFQSTGKINWQHRRADVASR